MAFHRHLSTVQGSGSEIFCGLLLMPIMYVCFTILLLLFNKHIIGIQSARVLQLSAGAFIGLSAFLFSLDGVGSLVHSDSFFNC
ncbi:hypothetical protein RQN30_06045 [Arcanobacterium hippocoleae]